MTVGVELATDDEVVPPLTVTAPTAAPTTNAAPPMVSPDFHHGVDAANRGPLPPSELGC
ncbi:hypothetical protein [Kribbella sp. NPDC050470]|uniref:hypothetical protein n=1 Tax=unclassified Kribbella TaxID=2644121 RepID=UPI0037BDC899